MKKSFLIFVMFFVWNLFSAQKNFLISLEEAGISNTEVEKVEYSKSKELLLELKSEAVKRSRITADKLVKPLNQKAGKALYISVNESGVEKITRAVTGASLYGVPGGASKIYASEEFLRKLDFEKIKFFAVVRVKYQLD